MRDAHFDLKRGVQPMQEFEDDDTARLPVAGRISGPGGNAIVNRQRPIFLEDDVDREAYFFDFDTIPRSKVVLPVLDDELEDTLRLHVIALPTLAPAHSRTGAWITTNGRFIILARILRMFGFGFSSVLLGVILAEAGLSFVQVSLLLSVALTGSVIEIIFATLFADRLGRRRTLVGFAVLMALGGLAFAFSHNLIVLLIAAFFGTINPSSTSENTPFIAIEQAILPQTCVPERLTDAFSRYNLWAQLAGAAGGLVVALPDILHRFLGMSTSQGVDTMFVLYALLGVLTAVLFICLTEKVEAAAIQSHPSRTRIHKPLQKKSRSNVFRLSSLFVLDAFAGGLVVQTIVAYWFRQRFGVSLSALGLLFFGANLASALSLPIAARLSRRFGLLKTMVFTHLPSQLLLLLVPFMPTFWLAALFLLCRQSLSKMDVPTRQVYIIELVSPEERTAAAGITTMARSIATSISPLAASALLANSLFMLGLPFLVAGSLSTFYDLLLYMLFRKVPIASDDGKTMKVAE
jgi:MFS family permease